ncbi:MAG TPA: hypothetical protein VF626_08070 [Chthoniobacterales bacterium]|jgi:hypothetical protein
MDFQETLKQMLGAAQKAAGAHWNEVRDYFEKQLASAANAAKTLALEVANEVKTPAQAKIELESLEIGLRDVRLALTVDAKAAAQEAINAALDVLWGAVNTAAGVKII